MQFVGIGQRYVGAEWKSHLVQLVCVHTEDKRWPIRALALCLFTQPEEGTLVRVAFGQYIVNAERMGSICGPAAALVMWNTIPLGFAMHQHAELAVLSPAENGPRLLIISLVVGDSELRGVFRCTLPGSSRHHHRLLQSPGGGGCCGATGALRGRPPRRWGVLLHPRMVQLCKNGL